MFFCRSLGLGLLGISVLAAFSASASERHYTHGEWRLLFRRMEKPDYPFAARRMFITGAGLFRMYIDGQGKVARVTILKSTGNGKLDEAAVKALEQWQAKPG